MSDFTQTPAEDGQPGVQPLRDDDTSIVPDPTKDPVQREWDRTEALDEGEIADGVDETAATKDHDAAQLPDDAGETAGGAS